MYACGSSPSTLLGRVGFSFLWGAVSDTEEQLHQVFLEGRRLGAPASGLLRSAKYRWGKGCITGEEPGPVISPRKWGEVLFGLVCRFEQVFYKAYLVKLFMTGGIYYIYRDREFPKEKFHCHRILSNGSTFLSGSASFQRIRQDSQLLN